MRRHLLLPAAVSALLAPALVAGLIIAPSAGATADPQSVASATTPAAADMRIAQVWTRAKKPLAGLTIALDPGHQLGNSNPAFRDKMAKTKFNGTITKGCNTTGTATNDGFPEATFVWKVSRYTKNRLKRLGAKVRMTRNTNSWDAWGPCVWKRGKYGAKVGADMTLSIHADGGPAAGRGFFVIVPAVVPGWTDDIASISQTYGRRFIDGMAEAGAQRSTYISGQMLVWNNVTTLNFSDVPIVLVEVGNMRNSADAAFMKRRSGQKAYADWLVAGIRAALAK